MRSGSPGRLRHSLAAIADVEAQLLQSSLTELHGTSLPLGRCLAECILYDERFSKRRVLLQYAHEVEHGRVLMSHETSHRVVPALARVIGPLCTGQLRKLKALHEKTPGVRNPCSWYGIHRRRRFAFEVNGEHGSVPARDYSTHAGDAGVVTTTL